MSLKDLLEQILTVERSRWVFHTDELDSEEHRKLSKSLTEKLRLTGQKSGSFHRATRSEAYCPDALRKKEWTIKTPLIEHLKETGELPGGCEIKPAEDLFYIS